jgi:plastocyanin
MKRFNRHFWASLAFAASTVAAGALAIFLLAEPAGAYQAETVSHPGIISGVVSYTGVAPKPKPIEITKDIEVCGAGPHFDQSLLVDGNGGIANAVVALKDVKSGAPMVPEHNVKFDQKGCEYIPRVLAFPAGSTVEIVNSDGILHNVHTDSTVNPPINMAQPGFKRKIEVRLEHPELIAVSCDAHNWMKGWWYVAANPYYAVTDASGRFTIRNVPPGSYTITVWQERLGTQEKKIAVPPGGTVSVDFRMSLPH